ncbi:MAG: hypothetical protein WCO72_03360 [Betaproteobacteria bacterium]
MQADYYVWAFFYLGLGAILVLTIRFINDVLDKKKKSGNFTRDAMQAYKESYPEQFSKKERTPFFQLSYHEKQDIVFKAIAYLIWPIGILVLILATIFPELLESKPMPYNPEDDFICKKEHLLKEVTVEQAESNSIVEDPLGRTPREPFGNLAAGWREFLSLSEPGFKLWAFKVPGTFNTFDGSTDNGRQWSVAMGERVGFAWVQKRKIKAEFLTEWD